MTRLKASAVQVRRSEQQTLRTFQKKIDPDTMRCETPNMAA